MLRGGFGVFFDRYVLANLNRIVEKDGQQGFEQVADGAAAAAVFSQAAGGPLTQPAGTLRPSMFRADPNLATSYSEQASLGFQFLLSKNLTAAANYLFVRGVKLSRIRNSNLRPPVVLTPQNSASLGIPDPTPQQLGRQVFGPSRLDSTFDSIYQIEDSASSAYNGFSLTLNRREKDFTLSASYTVSKTIDDASDFAEQPQNPFDLRNERALSLNDQAQRFVLSGLFDLPFGSEEEPGRANATSQKTYSSFLDRLLGHVELAPIITISSGRPINPLTGLDTNRSHAFPLSSRPLGFERNSLRTPVTATVDLRLLKTFYISPKRRLDFVVESFNLLNRTNVSLTNPFFGSGTYPVPAFAQPIDAFTARQVEFSIDLEY